MKFISPTSALVAGLFTASAQAAILSIDSSFGADTITRDTVTGLDWLDVTETRGMSYNEVTAQMGVGGVYEGWRYATMAELDTLIIDFGYAAINSSCGYTALHCDFSIPGDSLVIETMIKTLGDTHDAYLDSIDSYYDASPTGALYTLGILGTQNIISGLYDNATIYDGEGVLRSTGVLQSDPYDYVVTIWGSSLPDGTDPSLGSFLVQASPVPVPAAGWLFVSAVMGLIAKNRFAHRIFG